MSPPFHAVLGALLLLAAAPATNPADACKEAADRFAAAKVQVEAALQDYANCIAGSRGRNSCVVEFDEVEVAQERLETVIGDYREACR